MKQKVGLLHVAQAIDERVSDISIASPNGVAEVFLDISESHLLPVTAMGSGMVRAIAIAAAFRSNAGGLVLVDEIENGIHHKKLAGLWAGLYNLANECNVQLIASTHSLECVEAAIKAISADDIEHHPLHVYRMRRGKNRPMPYDGEALQSVVEFAGEVR
jgi:AAA15 family ATPase/GTPase